MITIRKTGRIISLGLAMLLAAGLFMMGSAKPAYAEAQSVAGQTVLVEGDSIQRSFGKYAETGAKRMGAVVKNPSRHGSTVAYGRFKKNSTLYRISRMSAAQIQMYKYIVITTGTNDYYSYYKVRPGMPGSLDAKTTAGALNLVIQKIQAVSPETKIVVVTPIHRYSGKKNCDFKKNKYGYTLADYRNVITAVAQQYKNVYIIQGTDISTAYEMKKRANTRDGLHPTKKYAKNVLANRFVDQFWQKVINQPEDQAKQSENQAQTAKDQTQSGKETAESGKDQAQSGKETTESGKETTVQ